MVSLKDASKRHTVVLAFDGTKYAFWCGDAFTDKSKMTKKEAQEYINEALKEVHSSKKDEVESKLNELYFMYEKSSGCRFWASYQASGKICRHIKNLLQVAKDQSLADKLEYEYYKYTKGTTTMKTTTTQKQLQRYAFKKHCLITGPKGFGKTYGAYQVIDELSIPKESVFEVGGYEGLESVDLLGQNIPFVKEVKTSKMSAVSSLKANANSFGRTEETQHIQDLVWLDGALSAAFRSASKGEQTVLLIDELYRIPSRELSILISSLTPDNKGFYTLRTRRIIGLDKDGCGIEEVIKCKKEHLWVVATTNVGADYDIEDIDSALEDRFMIIHKAANRDEVKAIVKKLINERKYKASLVSMLMEFYDKMEGYKNKGTLNKLINSRHLAEAVELSLDEKDIAEVLKDNHIKWIDRDINGELDKTQQSLVFKTVDSVFAGV
jgi:MoxR-like ATPase